LFLVVVGVFKHVGIDAVLLARSKLKNVRTLARRTLDRYANCSVFAHPVARRAAHGRAEIRRRINLFTISGFYVAQVQARDFLVVGIASRTTKQDGIVSALLKRKMHLKQL
jgi:hypothetical protein